jgi:hypothetical protein
MSFLLFGISNLHGTQIGLLLSVLNRQRQCNDGAMSQRFIFLRKTSWRRGSPEPVAGFSAGFLRQLQDSGKLREAGYFILRVGME